MTKDLARQRELQPMSLCEPCQGIQRNWRKAPGHPELVQRGNRKEDRPGGSVTFTRYVCDRCGTAWEYENDKNNQKAGWSVVGGFASKPGAWWVNGSAHQIAHESTACTVA
jgi:hypothetical protein